MNGVVYRAFSTDGELLYVGSTMHPAERLEAHGRTEDWWTEVSRVTLEHFPSREAALAAEGCAITAENPRYNRRRPAVRGLSPLRAPRSPFEAVVQSQGRRTSWLSDRTGVTAYQLRRYFRGEAVPDEADRLAIAKALVRDPAELWPELHEKAAA